MNINALQTIFFALAVLGLVLAVRKDRWIPFGLYVFTVITLPLSVILTNASAPPIVGQGMQTYGYAVFWSSLVGFLVSMVVWPFGGNRAKWGSWAGLGALGAWLVWDVDRKAASWLFSNIYHFLAGGSQNFDPVISDPSGAGVVWQVLAVIVGLGVFKAQRKR